MSEPKPLTLVTAFGPSLERAVLLAAHPDERYRRDGNPVADRRSLVLRLDGERAVVEEELGVPLVRSWYSSSGVGYCSTHESNLLWKWEQGRWSTEEFSDRRVDMIRHVFGFAGARPEDDELWMCTEGALLHRVAGTWTRHEVTQRFPYQIHGLSPSEVYIGGDELLRYDGSAFEELESPSDDETSALWVTPDDRLIVGYRKLSLSTADGQWERIETSFSCYMLMAELERRIFAATSGDGVVTVYPGPVERSSPPFEVNRLVAVGDGLIAVGDDQSMAYDGRRWWTIQMPIGGAFAPIR